MGCTCTRRVNAANESQGEGEGEGPLNDIRISTRTRKENIGLTILARFYVLIRLTISNIVQALNTKNTIHNISNVERKLMCTKARTDTQYDTADEKRTQDSNGVHRSLSVYEPLCRLSQSSITTPPLTGYMMVSPDWSAIWTGVKGNSRGDALRRFLRDRQIVPCGFSSAKTLKKRLVFNWTNEKK